MKLNNPFKKKTVEDEENTADVVEKEEYEPKTESGKRAVGFLDKIIEKVCRPRDGKFPFTNILDWRYNRVGLHTMTYDRTEDCYKDDYLHIPKKELPKEAVHMSRTRKDWFIDKTNLGRFPDAHELTAIFTETWRRNNFINEALSQNWKGQLPIAQIVLVAAVGIVAAFVCMAMFGMM